MVQLAAGGPLGFSTAKGSSWKKVTDLGLKHPLGEQASYRFVQVGDQLVPIGFVERDAVWWASVDLNQDGRIAPDEQVALTGTERQQLKSTLDRSGISVPLTLSLSTDVSGGVRIFGTGIETTHVGKLPNGVAFLVRSNGGVYDRAKAEIWVDGDNDGEPDSSNWLMHFKASDRVVQANDKRWTFSIRADGSEITFTPTTEAPLGLHIGSPAPDFDHVASDGEHHTLPRYRGKRLLIDFWATWCAPCIALHPEVKALAAEHDLDVLGLSADDSQRDVDRWLKRNPTPWPSAALGGPAAQTNLDYGVSSWPTHALIDKNGRLEALGTLESVRYALGSH